MDLKILVDETIRLIEYKIRHMESYMDESIRIYYQGQIDGLFLVATRLADKDQLMKILELEMSLRTDSNERSCREEISD